jgi:transcription initiation factor TFIID subunit 3
MLALKKKHSKTGEESRYQGTVLGKSAEEHPIVIEGGVESIKDWGMQIKSRETTAGLVSPPRSSTFSHLSEADDVEI